METERDAGHDAKPRRRRLSAAKRRASIDGAAQDLALADGLQNITHRSIAGHLGITHTLVVHHASDIGDLRVRACEALLREEYETAEALTADAPRATDQLVALIRELGRTGREDRAGVWLDGWSIGRRDPLMARAVRTAMDAWQALIVAILVDGAEHGEFSVDDPRAAAWEFIALLDGLNAHMLVAYGDPTDYPARLAAPLAARLSLPTKALFDPRTSVTTVVLNKETQ
ncbi:MAG: TetR family transcriptional regulator C-terminal domain-containing protein [Brevibacterium yomogidense]|uniref:TetR family transcriptional regulator C-terminal domain-containing protein n=1 Tax=Brevibacterium sp. Mu109 TaxID=1255669 RepID=UPI000C675BDC|nr:TetR family transcriptional regulator C-terminal domain-containing protein [Brevibacterium sp. Mu109]SMX81346.1 transcriptional regulator, TetR family [Brevibacterium sp. Mu109]